MLWAVSQACPLRRLVIKNNLKLFEYKGGGAAGYASGGFLSDSVVEGLVASGSQQQWLTRNTHIGKWIEGVWNMVFAGVSPFKGIYDTGAPLAHCGQDIKNCISPYVVVDTVPLMAEKPFISADATTGKYKLHIPSPRRNSSGASTDPAGKVWNTVPSVDFSEVYVANNETDTAKSINAKLGAGLHVVLAPGIYQLDAALEITKNDTVLLGLGIATLMPTAGTPVVTVSSGATGVRVAGLLLQAGVKPSPTLLQWGEPSPDGKRAAAAVETADVDDSVYGFIHDVNARVGVCATLSLSLCLSLWHALCHTHTLSLCHTHTLSLSHTHSLSVTHTHFLSRWPGDAEQRRGLRDYHDPHRCSARDRR